MYVFKLHLKACDHQSSIVRRYLYISKLVSRFKAFKISGNHFMEPTQIEIKGVANGS